MDAKKHKELLDLMISKSSYNGFINYCILVCVLKKFNCYDEFLDNAKIETIEKKNNIKTNERILSSSFSWRNSDRGDAFWRMVNIIYTSLMISDEDSRKHLRNDYNFTFFNDFRYLSLVYHFGVEKSNKMLQFLRSIDSYYYLFSANKLKNYFNKHNKIINEMADLKFKNNSELEKFLNSNGIY